MMINIEENSVDSQGIYGRKETEAELSGTIESVVLGSSDL